MSLSERIASPKTGTYGDPLAEFKELSLDDVCNQKADFGKAHLGKNYLSVWHQAPSWVGWMVKTYEGSQKIEHRKFLVFVEMMVQMEENRVTPTSNEACSTIKWSKCQWSPSAKLSRRAAQHKPIC